MKSRSQDGSDEPIKTDNFLNKQREIHKELSATVHRSMFAMLAYSASCAVIIAQPDVPFVLASGGVKIPIINADVSLKAFLIVGPLGLVAITTYLHLFLAKLERITGLDERDKQQFLFNFQDRLSRFIKILIFYYTPPILMLGFSWKSAADPDWRQLMYPATLMVAAGMFILYLKAKWRLRWFIIFGIVVLAGMISLKIIASFETMGDQLQWYDYLRRGLNLERAQLAEEKIRGVNLERGNLRLANLEKADLTGNNLQHANLSEANLRGADLSGANLGKANLHKADLSEANLSRTRLSLANLRETNLHKADLSGAKLYEADLRGVDLRGVELSGARLDGAYLSGANLSGVELSRANLDGADLSGANLSKVDLRGTSLMRYKYSPVQRNARVNLSKANLSKANLSGVDLRGVDLNGASLGEAELSGANLSKVDLSGANLSGTNLSGANLSGANLSGANLSGADLSRADLRLAQNLIDSMLCIAYTVKGADLDPELKLQILKKCPFILQNL